MSALSQFLSSIDSFYCIRDEKTVPVRDQTMARYSGILDPHKKALLMALEAGKETCMMFVNELKPTRELTLSQAEELKRFLEDNETWDVIVLSPTFDKYMSEIEGFKHVQKVFSDEFSIDRVYVASRRFMQKVKASAAFNGVEMYYFDAPFLDGRGEIDMRLRISIGEVGPVSVLDNGRLRFGWKPIA